MGGTSRTFLTKIRCTNRLALQTGTGENTNEGWTEGALAGAAGGPVPDRRRDAVRRFVIHRGGFFESTGTYNLGDSEDSTFTSYKLRSRAVRSTYSVFIATDWYVAGVVLAAREARQSDSAQRRRRWAESDWIDSSATRDMTFHAPMQHKAYHW